MLEYYRFKVINDLFAQDKAEEAMLQLKELQKRYLLLCEDNARLRNQNREYEDILYLARNLIFDGTFYWLNTGTIKQGPFCPSCYNRDGQMVRITETGTRCCHVCGEIFSKATTGSIARPGRSALAVQQEQIIDPMTSLRALEKHVAFQRPCHASVPGAEAAKRAVVLHLSR